MASELDPTLERLLSDELESVCSVFRSTPGEMLFLGVVVDEDGNIHFQYRATVLDDDCLNANFAIGMSNAIMNVLGGGVGER